jgi:hypothetical protein
MVMYPEVEQPWTCTPSWSSIGKITDGDLNANKNNT